MSTALEKPALGRPESLAVVLRRPEFSARFAQVLGARAGEFTASLLSVGMTMPDVDPISIVQQGMKAAALELPVEKSLGFAWIVPFMEKGVKVAQFQIGYKGFIQLALRTGHYLKMNVKPVNKEAFVGYDDVGEPIIDWTLLDETQEAVGYAFAWKLVNGFTKVCYWPKAKVEAHAKRYSQSYSKGYSTPWKTHFDQMAMKTVVKNELAKWGILSVQFQKAIELDQSAVDTKGNTTYPDGTDSAFEETPSLGEGAEDAIPLPTKPAQAAPAVESTPANKPTMAERMHRPSKPEPAPEPEPAQPVTQAQPAAPVAPDPATGGETSAALAKKVSEMGVPEEDFLQWLDTTGILRGANQFAEIADLPEEDAKKIIVMDARLAKCRKIYGKPEPTAPAAS